MKTLLKRSAIVALLLGTWLAGDAFAILTQGLQQCAAPRNTAGGSRPECLLNALNPAVDNLLHAGPAREWVALTKRSVNSHWPPQPPALLRRIDEVATSLDRVSAKVRAAASGSGPPTR